MSFRQFNLKKFILNQSNFGITLYFKQINKNTPAIYHEINYFRDMQNNVVCK